MCKRIAYITEKRNDTIVTGGNMQDMKLPKILEEIGKLETFYSNIEQYHRYEFLWRDKHKSNVINDINSKNFDVVIISVNLTSPCLMGYKNIIHRKIFWLCDSIFHARKNIGFFNIKHRLLANIFLKKESRLLRYEQCAYLGVDEINSLPKRYRKNACIIPFYIDIQSQKYYNENGYLLYMGTFNYQPNKEALKRILKIASSISSPIKIFGTNIPKIYHLPKNTELAGYVTSLDEVFMGAKALICPITSGSGIKNKVIEAMSYGIPVIGFKNAFTNLNIEHNKNVIIAKNLSEMIYIANNADLKHISKNAYLFIKDEMSKDLALNKILKIINKER